MSTEASPPSRLKRESVLFPIAIWKKMSILWKTVITMSALIAAGASGHAYLNSFDTRDDVASLRKADDELRIEIRALSDLTKSNTNSVRAVEQTAKEMREDVRTLLQHMLERPPGGHR